VTDLQPLLAFGLSAITFRVDPNLSEDHRPDDLIRPFSSTKTKAPEIWSCIGGFFHAFRCGAGYCGLPKNARVAHLTSFSADPGNTRDHSSLSIISLNTGGPLCLADP